MASIGIVVTVIFGNFGTTDSIWLRGTLCVLLLKSFKIISCALWELFSLLDINNAGIEKIKVAIEQILFLFYDRFLMLNIAFKKIISSSLVNQILA